MLASFYSNLPADIVLDEFAPNGGRGPLVEKVIQQWEENTTYIVFLDGSTLGVEGNDVYEVNYD